MSKKTLARQTAELIAEDLFKSYHGERVNRLVMEFGETKTGIGWCKGAVVGRIEELLNRRHVGKAVVK